MKYLNKFNIINEDWKSSLIKKIDYKREDDIRNCFMGLLDMGLSEERLTITVCDSDFIKSSIFIHNSKSLYTAYNFVLTLERMILNPDYIIKLMEKKAEFLKRLKRKGYKINIEDFEILSIENIERKTIVIYDFTVYHPDDKINLYDYK